jgi:isopentenyl phosphate kinase
MDNELIFLKLGGSLITDKDKAHTALLPRIDMLAEQVHKFSQQTPNAHILLGHGSGSFGHIAAKKYGTRNGVNTTADWQGFAEVWYEARSLNQIIVERFHQQGLNIISFPLSSSAVSHGHKLTNWSITPIEQALLKGLLPVIYGDVVLDDAIGGTILSTEEQFDYLARHLHPDRVLLAGIEPGIWQDFPSCTELVKHISLAEYANMKQNISGSVSIDVTGGMASKVESMFALIKQQPNLKVQLFSGLEPGALLQVLNGEVIGTILSA